MEKFNIEDDISQPEYNFDENLTESKVNNNILPKNDPFLPKSNIFSNSLQKQDSLSNLSL